MTVLLNEMQLPNTLLVSEAVELMEAAPKALVPHLIPRTKAPATRSARYGAVCYVAQELASRYFHSLRSPLEYPAHTGGRRIAHEVCARPV